MQNTAPERGAGSDDPTGRNCGKDRPAELCGRSIVRTGSSYADPNQFCPLSGDCRSSSRTTSPSCSSTRSPSWRSTVIGGRGAGLGGAEATGGANAGRNHGRKRGLAPDPTGGAASRRDPNERAVAGRCGAGRWLCCLDPRRLTVRRQPNGRVRLSRAVRRRVRCWAGRGRSR